MNWQRVDKMIGYKWKHQPGVVVGMLVFALCSDVQ